MEQPQYGWGAVFGNSSVLEMEQCSLLLLGSALNATQVEEDDSDSDS
jgi:hypothetical protein